MYLKSPLARRTIFFIFPSKAIPSWGRCVSQIHPPGGQRRKIRKIGGKTEFPKMGFWGVPFWVFGELLFREFPWWELPRLWIRGRGAHDLWILDFGLFFCRTSDFAEWYFCIYDRLEFLCAARCTSLCLLCSAAA